MPAREAMVAHVSTDETSQNFVQSAAMPFWVGLWSEVGGVGCVTVLVRVVGVPGMATQ